jgi:hypothetical protein
MLFFAGTGGKSYQIINIHPEKLTKLNLPLDNTGRILYNIDKFSDS